MVGWVGTPNNVLAAVPYVWKGKGYAPHCRRLGAGPTRCARPEHLSPGITLTASALRQQWKEPASGHRPLCGIRVARGEYARTVPRQVPLPFRFGISRSARLPIRKLKSTVCTASSSPLRKLRTVSYSPTAVKMCRVWY